MAGESQQTPNSEPDPSVLTTEQMLLSVRNLGDLTTARREGGFNALQWQIEALRRELQIKEAHRLELKADSEKALSTAMIAAEKAVQAALAAAEKARDQQTIASQLATTKSEDASKEQLKQQGETSTLAISGLTVGLNDLKQLMGEMRAEKRGGKETTQALYALVGFLVSLVVIGSIVAAAWPRG